MATIRKILIDSVLVASMAVAAPAFAQLSPTQNSIKQKLEQKLLDNGLTPQEATLLQTLTNMEIQDRQSAHRDLYAIGAAAGIAIVVVGSAVACVYGFLPGCVAAETEAEVLVVVP